jgi:hypothetical protein
MSERKPLFSGDIQNPPKQESRKPLFADSVEKVFPAHKPLFESCPDPTPKRKEGPIFKDAVIRRRVEVTLDDLRKYSNDDTILKKSMQQILETNIDDLCLKYVLDWGSDIQKAHAELIDEILNISTSPQLTSAKNTIIQIIQQLSEMDVEDVMKKSWLQSKESKIDKMKVAVTHLKQDAGSLSANELVNVHDKVEKIKKLLDKVKSVIEPYIITCSFYSEHQKDGFPNHLYISRLQSLLSTKLGIDNDKRTADHLGSAIISIVDTINNVMRNEIPLWCSNFSAVVVGSMDIQTLKQSQEKILQKLQQSIK